MAMHVHHKSDINEGSDEFCTFCADTENFARGGSDFGKVFFFLVDEGRDDPNTTISGLTLAHQRMAFRCRTNDGPTFNAGLVTF